MFSSIETNQISVISLGWSLDVLDFANWRCLHPLAAAFTFKATSIAPKLPAV